MLKYYFKFAIRNLIRNKTLSIVNILGLAIGIACTILISLWVQYELSFDKFHKNADNLYKVGFRVEKEDYNGFYQPGPLAKYLKDNFPEIEHATSYSEIKWKVAYGTKGFFCKGGFVDSAFFKMFSFPLQDGNPDNVLSIPNSVVISSSLSNKIFGGINPIGKLLKLNDGGDFIVTGVFTDIPKTSSIQSDFFVSFYSAMDWMKMWDRKCVETYVQLDKNATFENTGNKIAGVMNIHNPQWENILFLFPFTKIHLYEPGAAGAIIYIYIFSLLGILILLVACINFMNLSTARSEKRMKEIGIKKTVGTSRIELIGQFLSETILLSFISLLFAILFAELAIPFLNSLLGTFISISYSAETILLLCGITLITGLIAGCYPAIFLSGLNPMTVLGGRNLKTGKKYSVLIRKVLVVAQFSFSIFIITCVLFISEQINFLQSKNLGFNRDNVIIISTRGALQKNVSLIKEELLKLSFVESAAVSATNFTSFEGAGSGPVEWEGKKDDKILEAGFNFVDQDFAKTFQMKMSQGRFFSKDYSTDLSDAFVVNEAAVKLMGITNPVNKGFSTWFGRKGKIVGVISDFNTLSLRDEMMPVVLIPTTAANYLCVRISGTSIGNGINQIKQTINRFVPDDPFEYNFLDKEIESLYNKEQIIKKLTIFIALLAIFISCLGLFGLISFSSEQRTVEVGIRKVLGASVSSIFIMFTKDFSRWIILAGVISCPVSYYLVRLWLENFAYRIEIDLWTFIISGCITLMIAIITVSIQIIRSATANPVKALKHE